MYNIQGKIYFYPINYEPAFTIPTYCSHLSPWCRKRFYNDLSSLAT